MNKLIMGMIIWFTYVSLSTYVTLYNMIFGIFLTVLILYIMPVKKYRIQVSNIPRAFWALARHLWMTAKNTFIGGLQVARIVLQPRIKLNSGIVAVDPDCDHEIGRALSAHSISLSPGEFLVDADEDGMMYIHSLDVHQTEKQIRKEQKLRRDMLNMIFE